MRWAILGPFLISDESGQEVRIPGSRLRTLLAALLVVTRGVTTPVVALPTRLPAPFWRLWVTS